MIIFWIVGFRLLYEYSIVASIMFAFISIIPPLLVILFLESLLLKFRILEEQKRQTNILQELLEIKKVKGSLDIGSFTHTISQNETKKSQYEELSNN